MPLYTRQVPLIGRSIHELEIAKAVLYIVKLSAGFIKNTKLSMGRSHDI